MQMWVATLKRIIVPSALDRHVKDLELDYDGWRDEVRGRIRAELSNRKDVTWYHFRCVWKDGRGRAEEFHIEAKSLHPHNFRKGTAESNRRDIKGRILNAAEIWRRRKLKEQETLRNHIESGSLARFEIVPHLWFPRKSCVGWYAPNVVLFEPASCGCRCREGWIEALDVANVDLMVARYLFGLWFGSSNGYEEAAEEARRGIDLVVLKDRFGDAE